MSTDKYDIYVESFINEGIVETYFTQYYNNKTNDEINIIEHMLLNICKEMQFVDFEIEIGDKKIKSKIIPNKEEEIKNELEKDETGNKIEKRNNPQINIVLKPNTSVKFKTHYVQSLVSQELIYIYRLMRKFPNFCSLSDNRPNSLFNLLGKTAPHSLKANIYFQTFSQVSKFETKVDGGNSNIKYNLKNKKKYEIQIILESIKYTKNEIYDSNIPLISIMFQTENSNIPKLYKQYNPLNNETSYLLSFFKINNNEDTIIKTSSNMYYLLIDEEHSNKFSKNICKSLLESLSNDNYFQIIGYQKHFKLYNYLPMKCEKENIENSIKNISFIEKVNNKNNYYNNDIYDNNYDTNKSDFWDESIESDDVKKSNEVDDIKKSIESGEKDIDKAFEYIFNCNQKEIKDLNKFCFIVGSKNVDKNDISRLMKKYKNIDQKISIFIINIIDMKLELYSLIGIHSSLVETNLSENMFRQIQQSQNEVYDKVKITLDNKNNNEIIFDYYRNEFLLENQLENYFLTLKGKDSGQIDISSAYKKDGEE
jgi:hypothetical protein